MNISVEVDEIRLKTIANLQEPCARFRRVFPGFIHPFEPKCTLEDLEVFHHARFLALMRRQGPPHRRQSDLYSLRAQRSGELYRIGPHTADSVGRHQYLLQATFSSSDSETGRSSCTSLNFEKMCR